MPKRKPTRVLLTQSPRITRLAKKTGSVTGYKPFPKGKSNLSLTKFVDSLFEYNEASGKRLTDDQIIEMIRKDFGVLPSAKDNNLRNYISIQRSKYNRNSRSPLISLRYNPDGYPCKQYEHCSTLDDIRTLCFHYRKADPRFFNKDELRKILNFITDGQKDYLGFILPRKEEIEQHPYGSVIVYDELAEEDRIIRSLDEYL